MLVASTSCDFAKGGVAGFGVHFGPEFGVEVGCDIIVVFISSHEMHNNTVLLGKAES
jgi:hypothetical protein